MGVLIVSTTDYDLMCGCMNYGQWVESKGIVTPRAARGENLKEGVMWDFPGLLLGDFRSHG